ncbi:YdiU family protein [Cellvibrio sp. KY-GH-1]|uniref:protein adenylyltransferase SelO n=1 Tax=Cellvibrio sp. KY-GH-1 TaxID=2303332 RepID=UPI001247A130|nr:YdiU family protein [Cellvibrio sp. KY-GH-1]QEY18693.1 YdiU family protein [Cellvibrio sp. KY-GH-1]
MPLSLRELVFDNRLVREMPADNESENFRRQVYAAVYSRVTPTPVKNPHLIAAVSEVADLLQLSHAAFADPQFTQVFGGNELLSGMEPHACVYGGHQFGNWAGQLGDGRAINLGEVKNSRGEHWTLQLKGAGPTPYSRTADGLAVLRSSVREFLCSEAMFHLGVPTTRALSLVGTGELVRRDMFYDGNPQMEPGAVVCRVAPTFTRFGNFEIFSARNDIALLKQFTDFTLRTDFSALFPAEQHEFTKADYLRWFNEICIRTAQLMAHWMRVGFVHGVMNTDNMSVLGLTIDYGPYGWLEGYDQDWTPNTTDAQGRRYRYGSQPRVALWNLAQLANAIYPLIDEVEPLQAALENYRAEYEHCAQRDVAAKLGLSQFDPMQDQALNKQLLACFQLVETDMTIFYRALAQLNADDISHYANSQCVDIVRDSFYSVVDARAETQWADWLRLYAARLQQDYVLSGNTHTQKCERMNAVNPKYVLRNYLAQQAIDKATQGDFSEVEKLLQILRNPYAEQPDYQHYFAKRPEWARHKAGCSMLSCSS